MALFFNDNGVLKCRLHGENLWLLPWRKNALRVVSRPMSDPNSTKSILKYAEQSKPLLSYFS